MNSVTIDEVYDIIDLIQISPLLHKMSQDYASITLFCKESDYFLAHAIYFQYPNIILKPESDKSNLSDTSLLKFNKDHPLLPKVKQAFYLGHKGIGDMINLQGAVNYLSESVDELFVVCHSFYLDVSMKLYKDNKKVRLLQVKLTTDVCRNGRTLPSETIQWTPTFQKIMAYFEQIHICGLYLPTCVIWKNDWKTYPIPDCFYVDLGIDPKIKTTHNTLQSTPTSYALFKALEGMTYIFVHQTSSNTHIPLVKWDIQEILTIDPDTNLYKPGDSFYELANRFIKQNIFDYYDVIQNASEIYTVDSSYSCLGLYCKPLKAKKTGCYVRATLEKLEGWYD
jgi:hypothetical protein